MKAVTTLFRLVGEAELDLIRANGLRALPPRLPEQPYFHPVLNLEYATQITRNWNTQDERSGYVGYVWKFEVDTEFLNAYPVHQVGDVNAPGILDSSGGSCRVQ